MIMGGALLTKCLRVSQEEQDSPINDGGRPTKALHTGTKTFTMYVALDSQRDVT